MRTRERVLVWWVREFSTDGHHWHQVERRLVDALTGELLDQVLAAEISNRVAPPVPPAARSAVRESISESDEVTRLEEHHLAGAAGDRERDPARRRRERPGGAA